MKTRLARAGRAVGSVLLTLVLVCSMSLLLYPSETEAAGGSFGGGSGTASDPYLITDVLDLQAMKDGLAAHYALSGNIDASGTSTWNDGAGFEPVGGNNSSSDSGTWTNKFTGSFDGKGYTITGLTINRPDKYNVGLFGHIGATTAATTIKNVNLVSTTITGARGVGTLIGRVTGNANTLIENCSALTGSVTGNGATGGLIGSHNSVTESAGGTNNPVARYCFADISVTYSALGLTGADDKGDKFGGLAGCSQKGTIINSFARGSVTHSGGGTLHEKVGGLAGCILYRGQIINSYSTGAVSAGSCTSVGGLVGFRGTGGNAGTATNSFWDTETSGLGSSAGGTGKTTAEMKTQATFTGAGWDFTDVWGMDAAKNNNYPHLLWYYSTPSASFASSYSDASYTTACDVFDASSPTLYLKAYGDGIAASTDYVVAYYDGNADLVTDATETVASSAGEILTADYTFSADPLAVAGTWHAAVFTAGTSPPADWVLAEASSSFITADAFDAEATAIPEFSSWLAGLAVAAMAAGGYLFLRRWQQPA